MVTSTNCSCVQPSGGGAGGRLGSGNIGSALGRGEKLEPGPSRHSLGLSAEQIPLVEPPQQTPRVGGVEVGLLGERSIASTPPTAMPRVRGGGAVAEVPAAAAAAAAAALPPRQRQNTGELLDKWRNEVTPPPRHLAPLPPRGRHAAIFGPRAPGARGEQGVSDAAELVGRAGAPLASAGACRAAFVSIVHARPKRTPRRELLEQTLWSVAA